jgi:hypothetical protein
MSKIQLPNQNVILNSIEDPEQDWIPSFEGMTVGRSGMTVGCLFILECSLVILNLFQDLT